MDTTVTLRAVISDFQRKMSIARGEMEATSKQGGSHFQTLNKGSGMLLAGVAGAAVGVAGLALKMGSDLQDANRRLSVAIADSGHSFVAFTPQIQVADKQLEHFGFTNAQTNDALAVMVTGLGSPTKAFNALGVAADLATFKHVDLAQASLAVTKALEGNMRPLHQLGIDLPIAASSAFKVVQAQTALKKAQDALTAAEVSAHPTAVQLASDRLKAESLAMAAARADTAEQSAQAALTAVMKEYPDAANASSKGHELLAAATAKLKLAQDAALVATQKEAAGVTAGTGPHAAYERAVSKVADAQAKLTLAQQAGTTILAALTQKIGGQASDAAKTFAGRLQVAKAQATDLGAKLGMVLIPILENLMTKVAAVVAWFQRHHDVAIALATALGTVLAAAIGIRLVSAIAGMVKSVQGGIQWLSRLGAQSAITEGEIAASKSGGIGLLAASALAASGLIVITGKKLIDLGNTADATHNKIMGLYAALFQGGAGTGPSRFTTKNQLNLQGWVPDSGYFDKNGNWVPLSSAPKKAAGGPVEAGMGYWVGEKGPEWFQPQTAGSIIPHSVSGSPSGGGWGGGPVTVNVTVEGHVLTASGLASSLVEPLRKAFEQGPARNGRRGQLTS